MQIVITEGHLQLEPVPGSEEGSRSGYLLKVTDISTGVEVVVAMGHEHCAKLGAVMIADTEEHPAAPAPVRIAVAGEEVLRALPKDHLGKGGGRRVH